MKININFPLTKEALSLVRRINTWYLDNGETEIVFTDSGPYPHLTLLMGDIAPDKLEEMMCRIIGLLNTISPPTVYFTAPHRPASDSRFVFLGVKRPDCLHELKEQMAECMVGIFTPSEHGGIDIAPHVTVAYLTQSSNYSPFRLENCTKTKWIPDRIAVSQTGKHGTCIKNLDVFEL
ncbi:MAG: hypothetical protein QG577_2390 [Thermodesulfobacteriota bacterium]|nr:hypothetical protein [Thermodesulfobacteriota bacterium]